MLGGLRGEPDHVIRVLVGLVAAAAAVVAAGWALLSLESAANTTAMVVTVFAGAAVTTGFAVAPLIAGSADPLDPRRFALFGIAPGPLAAAVALASLVSVPMMALVALACCAAVMWGAQGAPVAISVVSAVISVVTCVLLARVGLAAAALFLRERRSRELSGVFLVGILVVVVPVGVFFASLEWRGTVPTQLAEAANVLALTPLGAAWALPAAVVSSEMNAGASALIAVATILVLGLLWSWLVQRLLTTAERPVAVRERGGLGWFAVAPGNAAGAVAARSIIYWARDRRYAVNVLIVPFAALLTTVPLTIAGVPPALVALVPVPIVALFFGWLPHNDLAYDSTAVWLHVVSGMRGVADRIGRLVPIILVAVPTLAIGIPLAISLHGRWALLPGMVGVCACLFFSGLGLSSISSALTPYAVSRPGDSPFQQPQRTGGTGVLGQAFVMLGALAFSIPALWWAWLALTKDVGYAEPALWGGLGIGVAVLSIGIAVGGAVFNRRGESIMEFAQAG
nr:hypothetical protein [Microbacterium halimionae]